MGLVKKIFVIHEIDTSYSETFYLNLKWQGKPKCGTFSFFTVNPDLPLVPKDNFLTDIET